MIGKEILKKGEAMEKRILEQQKAEFVYLCVREKKNNFEITVVILRYQKCWSLLFKKDFKIPELLPKHPFFTLETVLKMPKETNKGDVESICKRVTKPASKKVANAEFIWIDYK